MLRNAIIHIANEQPFMADLLDEPAPDDVSLIVRNIRTMNGKKPVFVDYPDSTFVMPITHIRFIEIPAKSYAEEDRPVGDSGEEPGLVRLAGRGRRDRAGREGQVDSPAAPAALRGGGQNRPEGPGPELDTAQPVNGDGLDVDLLRRIHEA
jgi:hypothetical protein